MEAAVITSVPQAMRTMKALGDESVFCDAIFLQVSRQAVAKVLYGRTQHQCHRTLIVEVRRRTRPMGVMSDRASMERKHFAVFTGINQSQGTAIPFPLTPKLTPNK
ncbi:MAG: hypothetical protein IID61_10850 [SAR324 cluster bacterium]|nr:hypothetical protein [SAR324 cluster bacterium]